MSTNEQANFVDDGAAADDLVAERCREFRQGDVVAVSALPILEPNSITERSYQHGAAIITQTCDLVQPRRRNVVVAPVVALEHSQSGNAKRGAMPQFVHLTHPTKDNLFVDLSHCATLTKATLAQQKLLHRGVDQSDQESVSKFAARVGRRFSRFPFPDEVQPWFRPLQDEVSRRHGRDTPVGNLLKQVSDIRIQSNNWNSSNMELTIHVIVPPDVVPHPDDFDPDVIPNELIQQMRPNGVLAETAAQIASRLLPPDDRGKSAPSLAERYMLWNAFAEAVANLCTKPTAGGLPSSVMSAVAGVTGVLWTEDEFSLSLYRQTESLDLEHLSPSITIFGDSGITSP